MRVFVLATIFVVILVIGMSLSLFPSSLRRFLPLLLEVAVRLALWCASALLDNGEPFQRVVRREEAWLYSFPRTPSYVPSMWLWLVVLLAPVAAVLVDHAVSWWWRPMWRSGDSHDAVAGLWAVSLALGLNGVLTNAIKLAVGRPRPDFLQRCYGLKAGLLPQDLSAPCSGHPHIVSDGRKSFPSGHSSFIFTSMMFVTLYWAGRWSGAVKRRGRAVEGSVGRPRCRALLLVLLVAPLFVATMVAVSRTCDYHHHWQDVLVGSVLGMACACLSYFLHFPADKLERSCSSSSITYQLATGGVTRT